MTFDNYEIDYTGNPLFLDESAINWVKETFVDMSLEEK